jgi:hypothetical protein
MRHFPDKVGRSLQRREAEFSANMFLVPETSHALLTPELVLQIAGKLPPSSRACLALSSKKFCRILCQALHTVELQFPRKQPFGFHNTPILSLPHHYQPERWLFWRCSKGIIRTSFLPAGAASVSIPATSSRSYVQETTLEESA